MDTTPVWLDMPSARTVNAKGAKIVLVNTTGHEKSRFRVVLACLAHRTKLKPMVIFQRKTLPKKNFPLGVLVHCHPKGWMDEAGMKLWVEKEWRSRKEKEKKRKEVSLLVWDSFQAHLVDSVKRAVHQTNTDIAVIPGGLTRILQPVDVSLNKPFKDRLRERWNNWMVEGQKSFRPAGNMRAASLPTVCSWVLDAWRSLLVEMVA